jgi:hypothetical protein
MMFSSTMKKLSTIPLGRFIYHEVRNSSEDEGSLIERSPITTEERQPANNRKLFLILNTLVFGVSVLIFMKSAALKPTDEQCSKPLGFVEIWILTVDFSPYLGSPRSHKIRISQFRPGIRARVTVSWSTNPGEREALGRVMA